MDIKEKLQKDIHKFFEEQGVLKTKDDFGEELLKHFEKVVMSEALDKFKGNQVRCSRFMGVNRNTFRKRKAIYGL